MEWLGRECKRRYRTNALWPVCDMLETPSSVPRTPRKAGCSSDPLQIFRGRQECLTAGAVEAGFRNLLGPGARDRSRYFSETFQTSLGMIMKEFPARN